MTRPREIVVENPQAGALLQKLERFLGTDAVDKRLLSVKREIRVEKGSYLEHWVIPNRRWWLGIDEARQIRSSGKSFNRRIKSPLIEPLETAAKIAALHNFMPPTKRSEYRQRILAADNLRPVLTEIDVAAHFFQTGCNISWPLAGTKSGVRSSDLLIRHQSFEFEVECKTKGCDAGRRVSRPSFYRLIDQLAPAISREGKQGSCRLVVSERMPPTASWRNDVVDAIVTAIETGQNHLARHIEGCELEVVLELQDRTGKRIDTEAYYAEVSSDKSPAEHMGLFCPASDEGPTDPVVVRLMSGSPDRYLSAVFDDLRDGAKQLSLGVPGIIVCFIPEIDTFRGLEKDSLLNRMTQKFFDRHAPQHIHSVVYMSDPQIGRANSAVSGTYIPTVRFRNVHATVDLPTELLMGREVDM